MYKELGEEIGKLVQEKQAAYGDSFGKAGKVLKHLYPEGIKPDQYDDMLCITRILDKLFRIANKKDAFGESPYKDIAGYGLLGIKNDKDKEKLKDAYDLFEVGTNRHLEDIKRCEERLKKTKKALKEIDCFSPDKEIEKRIRFNRLKNRFKERLDKKKEEKKKINSCEGCVFDNQDIYKPPCSICGDIYPYDHHTRQLDMFREEKECCKKCDIKLFWHCMRCEAYLEGNS